MVNSEKFSERIQKIMEEYDLNATAFADQIDVGRSSISHILSGRNKPSLDFVIKIIDAFPKVELYWLLNGKGIFPKEASVPESKNALVKMSNAGSTSSETLGDQDQMKATSRSTTSNPSVKKISRIVILYTDGSFEPYNPSDQ